jgi:hypothetical protein
MELKQIPATDAVHKIPRIATKYLNPAFQRKHNCNRRLP